MKESSEDPKEVDLKPDEEESESPAVEENPYEDALLPEEKEVDSKSPAMEENPYEDALTPEEKDADLESPTVEVNPYEDALTPEEREDDSEVTAEEKNLYERDLTQTEKAADSEPPADDKEKKSQNSLKKENPSEETTPPAKKKYHMESPTEQSDASKSLQDGHLEEWTKKSIEKINPEFCDLIREYREKTGKKPNYGLNITNQFKEWIKKNSSINEDEKRQLLDYSNNYDRMIKIVLENHIRFSNKSLGEIINNFNKDMDISISKEPIRRFAQKILTRDAYQKRFPAPSRYPKGIEATIRDAILNTRLSQVEISKKIKEKTGIKVPYSSIQYYAKKELSKKKYQERFPASQNKYPERVNSAIKKAIRNTDISQEQIAKKVSEEIGVDITRTNVQKLAGRPMTSVKVQESSPKSRGKYPKDVIIAIKDTIRNTNLSQKQIAKKITEETNFNISLIKVQRVAKKDLSSNEYQKRFPATQDKYPEHVNVAIRDLIHTTNLSQGEIAKKVMKDTEVEVSAAKVQRVAKRELSQEKYKERFPAEHRHHKHIKSAIKDAIRKTDLSQVKIAEKISDEMKAAVPRTTVMHYAKKELSPKEYQERFPADQDKYPEYINTTIEEMIRSTNLSQIEIAETISRETGLDVSYDKVRYYAKRQLSTEEYQERFTTEFYTELGRITHKFLENLFYEAMHSKGLQVTSEEFIADGKRIDNLIIIDQKFKEIVSHPIPPEIKHLAIDYSIDATQENFENKCMKNYQSEDTILLFVPITYEKDASGYKIPQVPFKENIKVLPIKNFAGFFEFNKEYRDLLIKFINKTIEVKRSSDEEAIKVLAEVAENLDLKKEGQKLITDFF